jgi:hypothetical protein
MKAGRLNSRELCDLLNFVLGLPERIGSRTIVRSAISPCVVTGWQIKPTRRRVESWCDAQLDRAGIVARDRVRPRGGRKPGSHMPREVLPWIPPSFRRAA